MIKKKPEINRKINELYQEISEKKIKTMENLIKEIQNNSKFSRIFDSSGLSITQDDLDSFLTKTESDIDNFHNKITY